jgi:hypothetical protein
LFAKNIHHQSQLRFALHEVANYLARLNNVSRASIPKSVIIIPEIRLIHRSHCGVIFFLNTLIPLVRIIHQRVEPENTPSTTAVAERTLLLALPTPIPAKMAAKERIVSGLVSVSKKVEAYAPR